MPNPTWSNSGISKFADEELTEVFNKCTLHFAENMFVGLINEVIVNKTSDFHSVTKYYRGNNFWRRQITRRLFPTSSELQPRDDFLDGVYDVFWNLSNN